MRRHLPLSQYLRGLKRNRQYVRQCEMETEEGELGEGEKELKVSGVCYVLTVS